MPILLQEKKFSNALFIGASLLALFILMLVFFLSRAGLTPLSVVFQGPESDPKYYLNENFAEGDQLITRVPTLKDMLTGPIVSDADPTLGTKEAPIVIVQFADFECQYCQEQEKDLRTLVEKYQARLIWKDYPQKDINSPSFQAALAGRCAQEQGKFWEYHDLLYSTNGDFRPTTLLNLADKAKINKQLFAGCLKSEKAKNLILANIQEANALGIQGIPFVYINDKDVMGQGDISEIEAIIKAEINTNEK
jgi:protein-disulfide isomerase